MWTWALLPVILAAFGTIGIWTVFGLAVSNDTVNLTVEFPYISTCGSYNPQSCLFSQICNICSVLGECFSLSFSLSFIYPLIFFLILPPDPDAALWIVIMRFQQVRDFNCASRVNTVSLVLGFISSIGISILGNFQQTVVMGAHLLGAFLAFFVGLAYFWVQVWLTYRAKPSDDKKWAGPARIIFCSLCTCLVLLMSVFHNIGYRSEAAMCEWALVMCFFMLFGIFSAEFRHIDFHQLHVQNEGLNKSTLESPAQHNK
ncbi:modulator of macroautophagy TMEM150B isoform X2 [Silurus meridionalis]|nr:modulator of macroautophagy TMEM150B isoform X2 [Silurus meridionalis]XP_046721560.1 modulator of macroautophagy TMEM150B isoform X2 [Silurus meridionalis]